MKEKTLKWLEYPNNGLYQSRKICIFQKLPKTMTSTPHPSLQQSRRYFRVKEVTWL